MRDPILTRRFKEMAMSLSLLLQLPCQFSNSVITPIEFKGKVHVMSVICFSCQ